MGLSQGSDQSSLSQIQPLLFPEVLCRVFTFLKVEELRTCRLVNNLWKKEANIILAKRINVEFRHEREIAKFLKALGARRKKILPFLSFTLFLSNDFRLIDIICGCLLEFLEKFGSKIKDLTLRSIVGEGRVDFEEVLTLIIECCPHLESLSLQFLQLRIECNSFSMREGKLNDLKSFDYRTNMLEPFQLKELLKLMPNLRVFRYNCGENLVPQPTILDVLAEVRIKNGMFQWLSVLEFSPKYCTIQCNEDITRLISMKLKLTKFIGVFETNLNVNLIYKFLKQQRSTLQVLNIQMNMTNNCVYEFSYPNLENVTDMTIHTSMGSDAMLDKLPKLRELKFEGFSDLNMTIFVYFSPGFSPRKYEYPLVQTLSLEVIDPSLAIIMSSKFPNIRRIEIPANDEVLLTIYREMPGLEEIKIVAGKYLTERGFIGISKAELATHLILALELADMESSPEVVEILRQNPFIGCLKKLRRLEIHRHKHGVTLPDLAVIFGICSIRCLRTLTIEPSISQRCVRALTQLPSLQTLTVVPEPLLERCPGNRSSVSTSADWFLNLLKDRPDMQVYVKINACRSKREKGHKYQVRRLKSTDKFKAKPTAHVSKYVYLDEIRSGETFEVCVRLMRLKCSNCLVYCEGWIVSIFHMCGIICCCIPCTHLIREHFANQG